ncbi:MAG: lytic murein transglycosylase [Rhodobacteraceae bacterium]|nr:lytic murein transglycosylase [Paracoccaceae bacterium]
MSSAKEEAFQNWVASYKRQAVARGVPQRVLDQAFRGVRYNEEVIEKDRNQAEFSLPIWDYLGRIVSDEQVRNGRVALRRHRRSLDAIEERYGVDKEVVVAVWGAETRYGETRGDISVVEATATLAFDGRRGRFFRSQLDETINILIRGDTTARNLKGSWAGAMGHTQFIPSSYRAYAVDFDGDGRRDIWANDPTDALASTAAYLKRFGWRKGQPVAVEVRLSKGADISLARRSFVLSPSQWAARGVTGFDGKPVPNYGQASLFLPAGTNGPAFLTFNNFRVVERYNAADAYVLAVGNLALRVGGARPVQGSWPVGSRPLKRAEIQELQERLTAAGFSTQGADGLIGPNTTNAIRQYQRARGLKVDGFASLDLLADLKR